MLGLITKTLKDAGIPRYIVEERSVSSAELFFVKKDLDVRREKKVTDYTVSVFREFEEDGKRFLGSSNAFLSPGMTEAEVLKDLDSAYAAAAYVRNPYYELYKGPKSGKQSAPSGLDGLSLNEIAARFTEAVFKNDDLDGAFLNSTEIFAERSDVRIVSSEGTDVSYATCLVKGEFIAQCKTPQDVEQYFDFEYRDLDTEALSEKVLEALKTVRDRASAEREPKAGVYDVVLSGEHIAEILSFYAMRANGAMVYPHYSDYKVGDHVQGDDVKGEKLSLTLVPNVPFSDEGIPMIERPLIVDGELKTLMCNARFAYYLGAEPTGQYRSLRLENGTVPFDEMKKGCLYPVSFSDFQMDPMSGHFGGEIRLAYLFTEEGTEILRGGSINGSFLEAASDLVFSKEGYKDAHYQGPLAVKIKNVFVSGS